MQLKADMKNAKNVIKYKTAQYCERRSNLDNIIYLPEQPGGRALTHSEYPAEGGDYYEYF